MARRNRASERVEAALGSAGRLFLREIRLKSEERADGHPFDIPAVSDLRHLRLGHVSVLAGDNGAGKSTIVEGLAVACGFNAEGGSRGTQFSTFESHSRLSGALELVWNTRPQWGWFLRAEGFYGLATYIASDRDIQKIFGRFHEESHGESFLDLALSRFTERGFYILDEPESALSAQGQLTLLRIVYESCQKGSQFVIATHSPLLMAYPGAVINVLDGDGIHQAPYDEVPAVQLWRDVLEDPALTFRFLFQDEEDE